MTDKKRTGENIYEAFQVWEGAKSFENLDTGDCNRELRDIERQLYDAFRAGFWWGEREQQIYPVARDPEIDGKYCPTCQGFIYDYDNDPMCPRCVKIIGIKSYDARKKLFKMFKDWLETWEVG